MSNADTAFAKLTQSELILVGSLGTEVDFDDGEILFRAGDAKIDLFVVLEGSVEIVNPADGNRLVVTHDPGAFIGDIDLLTGRPVLVTAIARGNAKTIRVPFSKIRSLLNRVPSFGEKLIVGFTRRREILSQTGAIGVQIVGPGHCRETNLAREFLYKNFVPFTWHAPDSALGERLTQEANAGGKSPIIRLNDQRFLIDPSLKELASASGAWQPCPDSHLQLAIIGAGPAGIAAAVYAASEGIETLLIDRIGAKRPIVVGWLAYAAIYVAFGFATSAWQAWALFLAYGFFYAVTEPAEKKLVVQLVGEHRRGLGFGWYHFTLGIAALPASLLFGWLYQTYGAPVAFTAGALLSVTASMVLTKVKSLAI